MPGPTLTRWSGDEPPTEERLNALLAEEGLEPRWWGNGPFDRYGEHDHSYHKVLYCLSGSITFVTGTEKEQHQLKPGDRLDLPPHTAHSASVGPHGCRCVEGWRMS